MRGRELGLGLSVGLASMLTACNSVERPDPCLTDDVMEVTTSFEVPEGQSALFGPASREAQVAHIMWRITNTEGDIAIDPVRVEEGEATPVYALIGASVLDYRAVAGPVLDEEAAREQGLARVGIEYSFSGDDEETPYPYDFYLDRGEAMLGFHTTDTTQTDDGVIEHATYVSVVDRGVETPQVLVSSGEVNLSCGTSGNPEIVNPADLGQEN